MAEEQIEERQTRKRPWLALLIVGAVLSLVALVGAVWWLFVSETRSLGESTSTIQISPGSAAQSGNSPHSEGLQEGTTPGTSRTPDSRDFTFTSPTPGINQSSGQMLLEVTIEPICGSWGTTMVGRIVTSPRAHVNFAVAYSDGQAYGQFGIARADHTGKFVYPWTIPPSAAIGKGNFLVGSSHESEEKSAVGTWEFFVREPGSC